MFSVVKFVWFIEEDDDVFTDKQTQLVDQQGESEREKV